MDNTARLSILESIQTIEELLIAMVDSGSISQSNAYAIMDETANIIALVEE